MKFLSKTIKCYLICSIFFIPPITSHAALSTQDNSEWQVANGQGSLFTQDQTAATNFTANTQNATPHKTSIAQQSVSNLPYEIVIWETDADTTDTIWQYTDTSDAQSLLESFQGLSIQRLSNSSSNNAIKQVNEYTELWNPNIEIHDIPLALQIEDSDEYLSFMRFWHEYGKATLTTLFILMLLRLLIGPIYAELKNKKRQKIRRSMSNHSHSTKLKSNIPREYKDQTSSQSLSKHGRLTKEETDIPPITTQPKNNVKRSRHKKNKTHASAQSLSTHGRVLALKPNKTQPKHRSSHRHYGHRHKPKPPLLKQIMDIFFYKPDT